MNKYKHIYVVILLTVKFPGEIQKYQELGAEEYLVKPSSYEEYIAVAKAIKEKASL